MRGLTAHPSAGAAQPGTYRALIARMPYLRALSITAVKLLPEDQNGLVDVILYDRGTHANELVSLPSSAFYIRVRVVDTSGQGVSGVAVPEGVGVSITDSEGR